MVTPNADSEHDINEVLARRIFDQAIIEERCAELLEALFDGGSATVDLTTGRLVIVSADLLNQFSTPSPNDGSGTP
jgi:hypothetical protein